MDATEAVAPKTVAQRIALPGAEVCYLRHLDLGEPAEAVMRRLIAEVPWRAETIMLWGRAVSQPRLTAWYGDEGAVYTYSGVTLRPLPWSPVLLELRGRVEAASGARFNSVLLNYYRDHRDSIGFHSDDEPELGEHPMIASLSIGEERTFVMKPRRATLGSPVKLRLASGSLLLMAGDTQRNWRHGVPKEARPCGPRVNLTFRTIQPRPPSDRVQGAR